MAGGEYTLVVRPSDSGFFSNVNRVVNRLHHTLGHGGCRAVRVDWRVENPRQEFSFGTAADGNVWDHFFEPLHFPDAPATEVVTDDYADWAMTSNHAYRMYKSGSRWRRAYNHVFRQHVRIRPAIAERASAAGGALMRGRFCVGVHIRHPAHQHECPGPNPPVDAFVRRTRRLMHGRADSAVFLATDIDEAVHAFAEAFGDRLIVQGDIERVGLGSSGHIHHQQADPRLALGEQVLIDALLLSRCDVLLHLTSNIATAAGYMNPRLRMVYSEMLHQGLAARARFLTPWARELRWDTSAERNLSSGHDVTGATFHGLSGRAHRRGVRRVAPPNTSRGRE